MDGSQTEPKVARLVEALPMFTRVEKVVDAEKKLLPENVLLFASKVEEAAVIVKEPPAVIGVVLIVASVPVRRLVPIVEVAMTFPFWSTARTAEARPESHVVLSVASVEVELEKVLRPVHVLLLESRVEDAALTVMLPPSLRVVPLMVPSVPVR
jgi:hypothetical protein